LRPVAESYAQLGLLDEAQSLLPRVLDGIPTPSERSQLAFNQATLFAAGGRPAAVIALLTPPEQFTELARRRQALLLLSESAWRAQRPDDTVRYGQLAEGLLTAAGERTQLFTMLGQAYEAQGDAARAVQAFRKCAEVAEARERVEMCLRRAAVLSTAQGQHQPALALYERLRQIAPTSTTPEGLLFRIAESYRQQTDTAQMLATFTRLRESTSDPFWHKVASEYLEQAEWQERLNERLAVFQNTLIR